MNERSKVFGHMEGMKDKELTNRIYGVEVDGVGERDRSKRR